MLFSLPRVISWGLYAVLFTPLIFYQQLLHPLITSKALFFQVLIEVLFALYLAAAITDPSVRPRRTVIWYAILGFFAALFLSAFFGVNVSRSFWSFPERLTGIFFLLHCLALFIMLAGLRGYVSWRSFFGASCVISVFVGLLPIAQLISPNLFFDVAAETIKGTVGNPNFLSTYLLFHIFIAGWLAHETYKTYRSYRTYTFYSFAFISLFNVVMVFLTQTRGAALALLVVGFCASAYLWMRRRGSPRLRGALLIFWLFVIAFLGLVLATRTAPFWDAVPAVKRVTAPIAESGIMPRLYAWRAGLAAVRDYPVFGWGWENFYYALNAHYIPEMQRNGTGETFFDKPHNTPIELLTTTGIVGLIAYYGLLAAALWASRKNPWFTALLFVYAVQNIFIFDTVTSWIMFFIVLAYLDSLLEAPALFSFRAPRALAPYVALIMLIPAGALSYYTNYRVWYASHREWLTINYLIQQYIPEGLGFFNETLAASTPYASYIKKDIAPFIGQLYKQNIALPDVKGLVARSARELEAAIAADSRHYGFYVGFADFAAQVHELNPALIGRGIAFLKEAEEVSPRRQTTKYLLSKLLYAQGDREGTLKALEDAVALDRKVPEAHFYHGLLLLELGRTAEAVAALDRAAELGRPARTAQEARFLGAYFADVDDYARAERYFQHAFLFEPDNMETKMKLGIVYYWNHKLDAARRLIAEVMKTEDLKQSPQYSALKPMLQDLGFE